MSTLIKHLIYSLLILWTSASYATSNNFSTRTYLQATECSALFIILSGIPDEQLSSQFTKLALMMNMIHSHHRNQVSNKVITNGDISDSNSEMMLKLGQIHDHQPNDITKLYGQCDTWRSKLGQLLMKHKVDSLQQFKVVVDKLGERPNNYKFNATKDDTIMQFVNIGFDEWKSNGRLTPNSIKNELMK